MKITFIGAAGTVTGSCYYLETRKSKFLVDCGMFQGHEKEAELNRQAFPFNAEEIDFILLTHAHIDHSGRIPRIFKDGFKGQVITTKATAELCAIMLPDSGHIQEMENEWENRKNQRAGKLLSEPLYTLQDALDCMKLFKGIKYEENIRINDEIRIRFKDAGHVLGSAILELWVLENEKEIKLVFSGDLGKKGKPIIRDPAIIDSADYLIMESTYGDRLHEKDDDIVARFVDIINQTVQRHGNVVIPSFAVGRTQEIIYELNTRTDNNGHKLKLLQNVPVYVDSPLAISATEVFRNNLDCFDEEARRYIENGENPLDFPGLKFTRTPEESKALNELKEPAVIISASGMCDAGRIKHHLKHNLWRPECTILFVGYQAEGTLGRKLIEGAKKVKLFGEDISVNAKIEVIEGFSGHADRDGLMEWLGSFNKKPGKVFVVHGEGEASNSMASLIRSKFGIETEIPERGEAFTIVAGRAVQAAAPAQIAAPAQPAQAVLISRAGQFARLAALKQLELLKEEFDELAGFIKNDLKTGKSDSEVEQLLEKLKVLEKQIMEILK